MISVKLPRQLEQELNNLAERNKKPQGYYVRKAIIHLLKIIKTHHPISERHKYVHFRINRHQSKGPSEMKTMHHLIPPRYRGNKRINRT